MLCLITVSNPWRCGGAAVRRCVLCEFSVRGCARMCRYNTINYKGCRNQTLEHKSERRTGHLSPLGLDRLGDVFDGAVFGHERGVEVALTVEREVQARHAVADAVQRSSDQVLPR